MYDSGARGTSNYSYCEQLVNHDTCVMTESDSILSRDPSNNHWPGIYPVHSLVRRCLTPSPTSSVERSCSQQPLDLIKALARLDTIKSEQ